ncbi:MAG TPA: hypothetical protein VGN18_07250 [Jatrophihabitans sp.]|jgi:hypothetical protein|uniref:hypothetical protein n=1 Tax=Jatrophihabitans sp. TaxID=1932789 RepID=UPI002DFFEE46|nr:hypothetical protein [Jatrophihabitans sp.]
MHHDLDVHDAADPIGRLAAYRPTPTSVLDEWDARARDEARSRVLAAPVARMHFRPARRTRTLIAPLAAVAAVVALIGGIVYATTGSGDDHAQPAGPVYQAPSYRDTPLVGPGRYSHRTVTSYKLTPGHDPLVTGTSQDWIAPTGQVWSRRTTPGAADKCYHFPFSAPATFDSPSQAFVAALPTDPSALLGYFRTHVSGSSSRDEAVFLAVGDMLRAADGLATSQLRAALAGMLSHSARVTVHPDVVDFRGRAAVRADFVEGKDRPGELDSLYFDASTYQLLEERTGSTPGPVPPYASTGYDASVAPTPTATDLTGNATITVMDSETVVDSLPADVAGCRSG